MHLAKLLGEKKSALNNNSGPRRNLLYLFIVNQWMLSKIVDVIVA